MKKHAESRGSEVFLAYLAFLALGLAVMLLLTSCAEFTGTDPKTGATYQARFVLSKATAASFGPRGGKLAGLDQTEIAGELIRTAGVAYGAHVVAGVQEAANAADAAVAIGAQKAGTAQAGINASVEKARIGADTIIRTTIPK